MAEACSHHPDGVDLCFMLRFGSIGEVQTELPSHEDPQANSFAPYGTDDYGLFEVYHADISPQSESDVHALARRERRVHLLLPRRMARLAHAES